MDYFRQQSTYGHLPNFAILFEKKLYLPNNVSVGHYDILGKWNEHWDKATQQVLVGVVQQDAYANIAFYITGCYDITQCTFNNFTTAINMPQHIFAAYWATMYAYDPLLSLVQIFISDFYVLTSTSASACSTACASASACGTASANASGCYMVCKTDMPDVYHVIAPSKAGKLVPLASCVIPNIQVSKYMYDLFEHKQVNEPVYVNLTKHAKTGKFIPSL